MLLLTRLVPFYFHNITLCLGISYLESTRRRASKYVSGDIELRTKALPKCFRDLGDIDRCSSRIFSVGEVRQRLYGGDQALGGLRKESLEGI